MERGAIAIGFFNVGLAITDIDCDGFLEVVSSKQEDNPYRFRIV